MTDHQNDDLDDLLRSAAQDYNRPGDAPRDLMWTEIRSQRQARAQSVGRPARHAKHRVWLVPAIAAAVLVLGIAIGRLYERWTAAPNASVIAAAKPDSATQIAVAPPGIDSVDTSAPPSRSAVSSPQSSVQDARRTTPHAERLTVGTDRPMPNLSFQLAVVEHLAGTEAMLTSFRAAAKRGEVDAQLTTWTRNLLTTTRLLQSSAAQQDPTMKRLLDDLELVLVQIAQYTSAGSHHAQELELIEHSIERRGVIGKLHTTIPDRLVPAGS